MTVADGPRYEAVVFDNDGVLVHPTTDAVFDEAARKLFEAFDVDPDPSHVATINDGPTRETVVDIATTYDIDPGAFWARHETVKAEAQLGALRAGGKPLYDDVDAVGSLSVPRALVSNNQHETVEHIMELFDLHDLFETYYGRKPSLDGMARRKPDPSYIEQAMDDLGTRSVLYVGDSNVDIEAAAAAGIDSAFVARPHRADYPLTREPTYRIDGLDELVELVHGGDDRTGARATGQNTGGTDGSQADDRAETNHAETTNR